MGAGHSHVSRPLYYHHFLGFQALSLLSTPPRPCSRHRFLSPVPGALFSLRTTWSGRRHLLSTETTRRADWQCVVLYSASFLVNVADTRALLLPLCVCSSYQLIGPQPYPIICIRSYQSATWSQRGTKMNGPRHGNNPLLKATGIYA